MGWAKRPCLISVVKGKAGSLQDSDPPLQMNMQATSKQLQATDSASRTVAAPDISPYAQLRRRTCTADHSEPRALQRSENVTVKRGVAIAYFFHLHDAVLGPATATARTTKDDIT